MKRFKLVITALLLIVISANSQYRKSISILGDSYSTFAGYVIPDTNAVWYNEIKDNRTDVYDVKQTWWHQLIKENNFRLCVNNSFSGATICNRGYRKEDYSDRSFCTRLDNLGSRTYCSYSEGQTTAGHNPLLAIISIRVDISRPILIQTSHGIYA